MTDNIILISCSSYHLTNNEIKNIVKDNNYTTYDLSYDLLEDVLEEASYFSLFDDKKYLIIKNANIFAASNKKREENKNSKDGETLLKYLEEPNPNTILIFTMNSKPDSKKNIVKIIKDNYNYIEVPELKGKELYEKGVKLLKDKGFKIEYNAMYHIINGCQNNYDLIYNEIQKISLYYNEGRNLTIKDIEGIVSKSMVDNNFKFMDAVRDKNLKDALENYDDLMLQKVEPIILISMIASEYRNLLLIKKMMKSYSKKDLMKELGIKYEFQLDKLINSSYNYKVEQLENFLIYICDMNYKIKRGKINSKLALQLIIMNVCK